MPLEEVEDMTWAEFQLRSYGFWEERKFQMVMTREISYEVHGLNYLLSKKRPPKKDAYWKIGDSESKKVSDDAIEAYKKAMEEYKSKVDG